MIADLTALSLSVCVFTVCLRLKVSSAVQAAELRLLLRKALGSAEGGRLFAALYRSWAHSAGATLSLCLLARAYEHAAAVVAAFADIPVTVEVLVQACFVRNGFQHKKKSARLLSAWRSSGRCGPSPVLGTIIKEMSPTRSN